MRNGFLKHLITASITLAVWILCAGSSQVYAQRVGGSGVGYIDNAIPGDQLRFRFDAAYGNDRPDRAEFFYGKCGCWRTDAPPVRDTDAPGPPGFPEKNIDYQDFSLYLEKACTDCFSGFIEMPFRFLNPTTNDNTAGMGDMNVGFKYAFVYTEDTVATFQFRTYVPTGDGDRGLGTAHPSIEPALLLYQPLCDNWLLEAEARLWISVNGTDFAGDVLRYGVGLSYDLIETCNCHVRPVAELVGWTVLNGKATLAHEGPEGFFEEAGGTTIINAKLGVRLGFGNNSDLYIGYGQALTQKVWYDNIVRVEFRLFF